MNLLLAGTYINVQFVGVFVGITVIHEANTGAGGKYDVKPGGYYDADMAVATFSSFYQVMFRDTGDVRELDFIVLSDFHIIYGPRRGASLKKSTADFGLTWISTPSTQR